MILSKAERQFLEEIKDFTEESRFRVYAKFANEETMAKSLMVKNLVGSESGLKGALYYITKRGLVALNEPKSDPIYPELNPEDLGEWYYKHVEALTAEGLHDKAKIAAQLAYRDNIIEELQRLIEDFSKFYLDYKGHYPELDTIVMNLQQQANNVSNIPKQST